MLLDREICPVTTTMPRGIIFQWRFLACSPEIQSFLLLLLALLASAGGRNISQSVFEPDQTATMTEEKDHNTPHPSPLQAHMNYLAATKRANKSTTRLNLAEAAHTVPRARKAELITDRIMELIDYRADTLNIPKLSASTKEQIASVMDGNPLLIKHDFELQMWAAILQTREKVLTTIVESKAEFAGMSQWAKMRELGFWRELLMWVGVVFVFYGIVKASTAGFSFLSVVVEGYFMMRYSCKADREYHSPGDVARQCWRVGKFCASHGMGGEFTA